MEGKRKIKVIIDTNWWISFLVSKKSVGLPHILLNEDIIICFSVELSNEIYETLQYARNKKRINELNLKQIIIFLERVATYYAVTSDVSVCRDSKDNFLLALAKDAKG